jgi:hypothetical protein
MVLRRGVTASGLADGDPSEPGVACYNAARTLLADGATSKPATSSLTFAVASTPVNVPLRLTTAEFSDGTHGVIAQGSTRVTMPGVSAPAEMDVIVEGTVTSRAHTLLSARLSETTLVPAAGGILARTTCAIAPMTAVPLPSATAQPVL